MRKKLLWLLTITGSMLLAAALLANFFALDPSAIEKTLFLKVKPIAVKLPDPPKADEHPPPPEQTPQNSMMAELAPDSFSNSMQDLGAGIGFGGSGGGPAIGGGGGFGSDAGQLVKNQTSVDRPPRAVVKSAPEYPSEARSRSISGFVVVRIFVGLNGVIENVKVEKSEPQGFFDQAALKAIRSWRFEPAIIKGQTVSAWTTQKIKFELN